MTQRNFTHRPNLGVRYLREQIELLQMHKDGIMVAEYWTEMFPKKELERKLHLAVAEAREQFERKKLLQ